MKSFLSISIAILIVFQSFGRFWIVMCFEYNQEYIAQNLCIQKEILNNSCQGHCQLIQKLNEAEQNEQKQNPNAADYRFEVLFFTQTSDFLALQNLTLLYAKLPISFYVAPKLSSGISDIFHPPQSIS